MASSDTGNANKNTDRHDTAVLDDDKPLSTEEFEGATLQIGTSDNAETDTGADDETEVMFAQPGSATGRQVGGTGHSGTDVGSGNLSRNRPGSVIGRASVRSTSSRTSMRPGVVQSDMNARSYYCYKESHFDKAVEKVKHIIKPELDGELKSSWLLTEIDHWDLEREKVVLLTDYSMFIVKYNFINETMYEYRRIMLHIITSINIGDFSYPNVSIMPDRKHGGIQIRWDRGQELTFGQKWNPWCSDIPWVTLAHHPLIYNEKENETVTYNVDEFFEALIAATSKVFTEKRPGENLTVVEGPITIESYANPASLIFNQSSIGFFKDRNGVCF